MAILWGVEDAMVLKKQLLCGFLVTVKWKWRDGGRKGKRIGGVFSLSINPLVKKFQNYLGEKKRWKVSSIQKVVTVARMSYTLKPSFERSWRGPNYFLVDWRGYFSNVTVPASGEPSPAPQGHVTLP